MDQTESGADVKSEKSGEELAKARRRLARYLGAVFVHGMSCEDVSFEVIAKRIGKTEEDVRAAIYRLIDGIGVMRVDEMSDITFGIGLELTYQLVRKIDDRTDEPKRSDSA